MFKAIAFISASFVHEQEKKLEKKYSAMVTEREFLQREIGEGICIFVLFNNSYKMPAWHSSLVDLIYRYNPESKNGDIWDNLTSLKKQR